VRNLLILAGVIAVLIVATLFSQQRGASGKEVTVQPATMQIIESSIITSGSLAFREEVKLTSEVIARVTEVSVEEGDNVVAGQILLKLDQEQFLASVSQRQANVRIQEIAIRRQEEQLAVLESRWKRQKSLWESKLIQEQEFEAIDSNLRLSRLELSTQHEALLQAKAQLAEAEDYLRKTIIRSPIDGRIITLDIKEGETAIASNNSIAGSSLMTIADTSDIITEVFVDEADIAMLKLNQRADVYPVAFPDTAVSGTVEHIASSARAYQGRQGLRFKVKLKLTPSPDTELFSGMSCRAEIFQATSNETLSIPIEALVSEIEKDKTKYYVYRVENGTAKKLEVTLGASSDSLQEITSGISIDDQIITGPFRVLQTLKDGAVITVKDDSKQVDDSDNA